MIIALIAVTLCLNACKSHKPCDAYGEIPKQETTLHS